MGQPALPLPTVVEVGGVPSDGTPCLRCLKALEHGEIRTDMVMPLPTGAYAPLSRDGSGPCCHDCASADTVQHVADLPTWGMARLAVGNDRAEQLRLPGAPFSLVPAFVRPSLQGDMNRLYGWHAQLGFRHFGEDDDDGDQ